MRIAGYLRVSTAEQVEGYSLDAQRSAIRRHCEEHGYDLIGFFVDEGISGKHDNISKRPGFQAVLEAVEKGHADAIAVHKLDRFARNARVFHESLHRIDNRVIFVADGIDPNTPVGELMAGIMAQFSQFFSRNLATEVKKGLDERRKEGLYNGGPLPFGTRKDPDAKERRKAMPVQDATAVLCRLADRTEWSRYDALTYIFEQTVLGKSAVRIANDLRSIGFELSAPGVRHIVLNRFYVGEIPMGHKRWSPYAHAWAQGAHKPLIDPKLFEAANRVATNLPSLHRVNSVRRAAQTWALSGLLTCGRCRGPMHVKSHRDGTRVECYNRYDKQRCDQPSFKQDKMESQVIEVVKAYAVPESVVLQLESLTQGKRESDPQRDMGKLKLQRQRLDDLYVDGLISKVRYLERAERMERELAELDLSVGARSEVVEIGRLLRNLPLMYEVASQKQRNELLHLIFEGFMVDHYTVVAVKPRLKVAALLRADRHSRESNQTETAGDVEIGSVAGSVATFHDAESNLGRSRR
jgi:site-specific DNA recombinase